MATDIKDLRECIDYYYNAYSDALTDGSNQRDFNYGNQWTQENHQRLEANNIPPLIQNEISKHIKAVLGEFALNTPQPQVVCHNPETPSELIDAYDYSIKSICNRSASNRVFLCAFEDALRTGCGGGIYVYTDYESADDFKMEIYLKYIDYASLIIDPDASDITRCDGSFGGYFEQMNKEKFRLLYPGEDPNSVEGAFPGYNKHYARDDKNVILAHLFKKELFKKTIYLTNLGRTISKKDEVNKDSGEEIIESREAQDYKIVGYIFNGSKILEEKEFPIKRLPLVYLSGYQANIQGQVRPYSFGYDLQDTQKLKNFTASQLGSTILNLRKETHIWDKESVDSATAKALQNPQKQQGALFYSSKHGAPPTIIPPPQLSTTLIDVYQGLNQQIDSTLGRYEAGQGAGTQQVSGIAQSLKIGQNNINIYFYVKNAINAINQTGKILKDLIPQVYVENRNVGIEGKSVTINDPSAEEPLNFSDIDPKDFDINIKAGSTFEAQRQQYLNTLLQVVSGLPDEARLLLSSNILELMDLPNISDISTKINRWMELRDPQLAALQSGESAEQIQQKQAQQQAQQQGQNPEAQAMQMEQQIKMQELQLKERDQKLKEIQALSDYQLSAEKMDQQHEESKANIESTRLKSEAEIKKAYFELLKADTR